MRQCFTGVSESHIPCLWFTGLKKRLQIIENKNPAIPKGQRWFIDRALLLDLLILCVCFLDGKSFSLQVTKAWRKLVSSCWMTGSVAKGCLMDLVCRINLSIYHLGSLSCRSKSQCWYKNGLKSLSTWTKFRTLEMLDSLYQNPYCCVLIIVPGVA